MRLEARVTLWLLVVLGAGAAVTLAAIGWTQERVVDEHARETARLLAESVSSTLEVSMLNNSPEDIQAAVRSAEEGTLMDQVTVYGRNGQVWVSSSGSGYQEPQDEEAELGRQVVKQRLVPEEEDETEWEDVLTPTEKKLINIPDIVNDIRDIADPDVHTPTSSPKITTTIPRSSAPRWR